MDTATLAWKMFVRDMLIAFAMALALPTLFVIALNPYGNLPKPGSGRHVIMDSDQRFQYPSIARSGRYDSAVFGTSSGRLLSPVLLERHFGGTFANLALNDGRAWEQYQLALLYLRHTPAPRMILFALDWVWCTDRADVERTRQKEFPQWLYDENPWNDWQYVLNGRTLEISVRKLSYHLGLGQPRFPENGFEVFVPPDETYDLAKARAKIFAESRAATLANAAIGTPAADSWKFPALAWLDDLGSRVPATTKLIFAFMPAHTSVLPGPGTRELSRLDTCKARVAEMSAKRDSPVVDFRFASPLTIADENFWDPLHYRLPIGDRIIDGIAMAEKSAAAGTDIWHRILPSR